MFSASSPHFDSTIQELLAESGHITEHNVPPNVQVPVHVLLRVKGSHGRLSGSHMRPEIGYIQSVLDCLGRWLLGTLSGKPWLQICRSLPMVPKFWEDWKSSQGTILLGCPLWRLSVTSPRHLIVSICGYQKLRTRVNNNSKKKLFAIGREDLANLSWAQPTYSALFLIPQMDVPYKCGTI